MSVKSKTIPEIINWHERELARFSCQQVSGICSGAGGKEKSENESFQNVYDDDTLYMMAKHPVRYVDSRNVFLKRARDQKADQISEIDGLVWIRRYGSVFSQPNSKTLSHDEFMKSMEKVENMDGDENDFPVQNGQQLLPQHDPFAGTWSDLVRSLIDVIVYELLRLQNTKVSEGDNGKVETLFPDTIIIGFDKHAETIKADTGAKRADTAQKTNERQMKKDINQGFEHERDIPFTWDSLRSEIWTPASRKLPYPWLKVMGDKNMRACAIRFVCINIVNMCATGQLARILFTRINWMWKRKQSPEKSESSSSSIPQFIFPKRYIQIILDGHHLRAYDLPVLKDIATDHIGKNRKVFIKAIFAKEMGTSYEQFVEWESQSLIPQSTLTSIEEAESGELGWSNEFIMTKLDEDILDSILRYVPIHLNIVFDEELKIYAALEKAWVTGGSFSKMIDQSPIRFQNDLVHDDQFVESCFNSDEDEDEPGQIQLTKKEEDLHSSSLTENARFRCNQVVKNALEDLHSEMVQGMTEEETICSMLTDIGMNSTKVVLSSDKVDDSNTTTAATKESVVYTPDPFKNPYEKVKNSVEQIGKHSFSRFDPNTSTFGSYMNQKLQNHFRFQTIVNSSYEETSRVYSTPLPTIWKEDIQRMIVGMKVIYNRRCRYPPPPHNNQHQSTLPELPYQDSFSACVFSFVGDPNINNKLAWIGKVCYPDFPQHFYTFGENEVGEFDFAMFHFLWEASEQQRYVHKLNSAPESLTIHKEDKKMILHMAVRLVTIDTDAVLQGISVAELYMKLFNTCIHLTMVNTHSKTLENFVSLSNPSSSSSSEKTGYMVKKEKALIYNISSIVMLANLLYPRIRYPAGTIAWVLSLKTNDYCSNFINGISHESYLNGIISYLSDATTQETRFNTKYLSDLIIEPSHSGKWHASRDATGEIGKLIPRNALRTFDVAVFKKIVKYIVFAAETKLSREIVCDDAQVTKRLLQYMYLLYLQDDSGVGNMRSLATRTVHPDNANLYGFHIIEK